MIKYKNLFLAAICIAAGTLAIMTNLHKPSKNMVKSTTTLNNRYETESTITNMREANINIKNLNFSLNDNSNSLSKIVLKSEESVFGFKSIYTLATIPHKIIKSRKAISNINKKINKNNIRINSEIKNIKESFVVNKTITYSNYIRMSNRSLFIPLNFSSGINNNIKSWIPKSNIKKNMDIYTYTNDVMYGLLGFSGTLVIAFIGGSATYLAAPSIIKSLTSIKLKISRWEKINGRSFFGFDNDVLVPFHI